MGHPSADKKRDPTRWASTLVHVEPGPDGHLHEGEPGGRDAGLAAEVLQEVPAPVEEGSCRHSSPVDRRESADLHPGLQAILKPVRLRVNPLGEPPVAFEFASSTGILGFGIDDNV